MEMRCLSSAPAVAISAPRFTPPHLLSSFSLLPSVRSPSPFSPLPSSHMGSPGLKRNFKVFAMASEDPFDTNKFAEDTLKNIQEAWDKTEDKLALGTVGFSAFLAIWASGGILSAVDKLPLIPNLFELVGVGYSTWFTYRYILFKPDREKFLSKVAGIWNRIIGHDET